MGSPMDRTAVARTIFQFWCDHSLEPFQALAFVGNDEGEMGLRDPVPVGDHGEAFGIHQWHWHPRGEAILKATQIDVRKASIADQCLAAWWELNEKFPKTLDRIRASKSTAAAIAIIVHEYEGSRNQTSDIEKRTAYAMKWAPIFGVKMP